MDLLYFTLLLSPFIVGMFFCNFEATVHDETEAFSHRFKSAGGKFGIIDKYKLNCYIGELKKESYFDDIVAAFSPSAALIEVGRVSKLYNISNSTDI